MLQKSFYLPYLLANGVNESSYLAYLKGDYFNSKMINIEFEKATRNFSDFISDDYVHWHNDSGKHSTIVEKENVINTYNGFWRDQFYRCYGINTPYHREYVFTSLLLDGNIFPTTTNKSFRPSEGNSIFTIFHYPSQLLNSIQNVKYLWPIREDNKNFLMKFQVDGVEILKRRNKRNSPCETDWEHYDENVLNYHVTNVGCKAPYQLLNKDVPICSSKEKMAEARMPLNIETKRKYPFPCKAMEKILYTYSEFEIMTNWKGRGKFAVSVYFFDQGFKEITQSRYIYISCVLVIFTSPLKIKGII